MVTITPSIFQASPATMKERTRASGFSGAGSMAPTTSAPSRWPCSTSERESGGGLEHHRERVLHRQRHTGHRLPQHRQRLDPRQRNQGRRGRDYVRRQSSLVRVQAQYDWHQSIPELHLEAAQSVHRNCRQLCRSNSVSIALPVSRRGLRLGSIGPKSGNALLRV